MHSETSTIPLFPLELYLYLYLYLYLLWLCYVMLCHKKTFSVAAKFLSYKYIDARHAEGVPHRDAVGVEGG